MMENSLLTNRGRSGFLMTLFPILVIWSPLHGSGLDDVSLQDLFDMKVVSVSKRTERAHDAAASVYVITEEDIRRSGATRLQDIFQMVPGLWFADQTFNLPVSGIREHTTLFTQSINVLVDGVPITSPVTGGLYYAGLYLPLENIRRIEVIKGPGGTIYGANSASGIINIFTHSPRDIAPFAMGAAGGNGWYAEPWIQAGTPIGERTSCAGFLSLRSHRGYDKNPAFAGESLLVRSTTFPGNDTAVKILNRFTEADEGHNRSVFGQVDVQTLFSPRLKAHIKAWAQYDRGWEYSSQFRPFPGSIGLPPFDSTWLEQTKNTTVSVNARLDLEFSPIHSAFLRSYWIHTSRVLHAPRVGSMRPAYHIADIELQDILRLFGDSPVQVEIITGGNFRPVIYDIHQNPGDNTRFIDPRTAEYVIAGFIQDKISFGGFADIITGIKAETWTLISAKPKFSPSARICIRPLDRLSVWGAWSRSVTIPGYAQTNVEARAYQLPPEWFFTILPPQFRPEGLNQDTVPAGAGKVVALVTSPSIRPTTYYSTEAGVRLSLIPRTFIDFSGYYILKQDKIDISPIDANTVIPSRVYPDSLIVPAWYANTGNAVTYGQETIVKFNPLDAARLEVSYGWYQSRADWNTSPDRRTSFPDHIVRARGYLDLPSAIRVTVSGLVHSRYRGINDYDYLRQEYPITGSVEKKEVEPRVHLDAAVEKKFGDRLSLSVWGRDLLADAEIESSEPFLLTYPHTVNRLFGTSVRLQF